MANKRIYLCLAHMSDEGLEQKYIKEAFDTNWVVPLGPNVNGFEKDLEDFVSDRGQVPVRDGQALMADRRSALPLVTDKNLSPVRPHLFIQHIITIPKIF